MVVQRLLREAGRDGVADDVVAVVGEGLEAQADWANLESPETYLGYEQGVNFASPGRAVLDEPATYVLPDALRLNQWALSGEWTIGRRACLLSQPDGRITYRFHARDLHLVLKPGETSVRFRVSLDGEAPGASHGTDVDDKGEGVASEPRLYQLIRQSGRVEERTFEITFLEPGIEAYVFTFG
jgi:hypothetical protein